MGNKMSAEKIPPKAQQYLKQLDDLQKTYATIITQKQQLQVTHAEYRTALEAIKEIPENGEVYRQIGTIFFKTTKENIKKELEEGIQILEARIKALETQERQLKQEINNLRSQITKILASKQT